MTDNEVKNKVLKLGSKMITITFEEKEPEIILISDNDE